MSNNNIMKKSCIEYFNENNIKWGYIVYIKNKHGVIVPKFNVNGKYKPYTATFDPQSFSVDAWKEKYKTKEIYYNKVIKKSQDYPTDFIAYDTTHINCIDIDDKSIDCAEWEKKYSFLRSRGKKLPHFFCHITDKDNLRTAKNRNVPKNNQTKEKGAVDILTGQASYCKANEIVYDFGDIKNIDFTEVYKLCNIEPSQKVSTKFNYNTKNTNTMVKPNINDDVIYSIFNGLSHKRYEDFDNWFQIGSFLKWFYGYEKGLQRFKLFSSKSTRQKDQNLLFSDAFEAKYKGFGIKQVYSIYTFLNWLKQDNELEYKNVQSKLSGNKKIDHEYQLRKEEFEKNHFHVVTCNLFFKLIQNEWYCYNKKNFTDVVAQYDYTTETKNGMIKNVVFFTKWLKDPLRRKYNFIDWVPCQINDPNTFNEFQGFRLDSDYDNEDNESVETFLNHIKYLAGDDDKSSEYLINYIAHLFQFSNEKPQTAIVIKSPEGYGKDLLIDILQKIIGSKFIMRTSDIKRDVFGSSNGGVKHKLILQLNEVSGKDGFQNADKLKDIITTDKILIRELYKDVRQYSNYLRLFIFSNNNNPIKITETSRRFVVLEPLEKKNHSYYEKLVNILSNENALKNIYNYFKNRDISNFKITHIPVTVAKQEMAEFNRPMIHEFLIDHYDKVSSKKKYFISSTKLLQLFSSYLVNNGCNDYKISSKHLKLQLKKINFMTYARSSKTRGYKFNLEEYKLWVDSNIEDIAIVSDSESDDESESNYF